MFGEREPGQPDVRPPDRVGRYCCAVKSQSLLISVSRGFMVGFSQRYVAQALDAVGLAEKAADLLVKGERATVERPCLAAVRLPKSDCTQVAEALDAVRLAKHIADLPVEFERAPSPGC
jgi:hypothetical protein